MGQKTEKEGRLEELVGNQKPGPEAPPMSKIGKERREQRKCQGRSDCHKQMEKSTYVRVIGREDMIQLNTSSSQGSEVPFESQRV